MYPRVVRCSPEDYLHSTHACTPTHGERLDFSSLRIYPKKFTYHKENQLLKPEDSREDRQAGRRTRPTLW